MNIIFDFCKNVWHSFVKLKGEATLSNNKHKNTQVLAFPKCGLPFLCFKNYQRLKEILKSQKRQTAFWKCQDY